MVRIERVMRSSGGMDGKLMLENVFAADRSARSDAVRLDLKTARRGLNGINRCEVVWSTSELGILSVSRSSASCGGLGESGCSSMLSGGERIGPSDLRMGLAFLRCRG